MKLTWFGNTAFRIHIGGQVMAIDTAAAPAGVDQAELAGGADHVISLDGNQQRIDPMTWKPRSHQRLLDAADGSRPVLIWTVGGASLLIDGDDDMPLLLLVGEGVPQLGRWIEKAVVVLAGADIAERAAALLGASAPRLVALAGAEADIGVAIDRVRDLLDGTGLLALEPGMAVEA